MCRDDSSKVGGRLTIGVLAHFATWSSMNDQCGLTCKKSSRRRPGSSQTLEAPRYLLVQRRAAKLSVRPVLSICLVCYDPTIDQFLEV